MAYSPGSTGLEHIRSSFYVDRVEKLPRMVWAGRHYRGQMHHAIDSLIDHEIDERRITNVQLIVRNAVAFDSGSHVNTADSFYICTNRESLDDLRADETGTAGDEDSRSDHTVSGRGTGCRLHQVDTVSPDIKCQTPHQAATMAIPPRPSKKENTRMSPRAEF